MKNTDKQLNLPAYSREVNVDSTFKYMGEVITFLAKASETNGRFAFMEVKVRPGTEPPPHVHEREHELFFVLEGAIRCYTPEKTFDVQAGGVGFLPQGKPHTFACLTNEIRALLLQLPAAKKQLEWMATSWKWENQRATWLCLMRRPLTRLKIPSRQSALAHRGAFASSRPKRPRKRFRSILASAYEFSN
jgi:quercetin dioxygenase-like cupin family protein